MNEEYLKKLVRNTAIVTAAVVPLDLIVCAIIGGEGVLAGAAVGLALAMANAAVVLLVLWRGMKAPVQYLPSILMVSYLVRVLAIALILWGLVHVKALSGMSMLISFLVLFIAVTCVEMYLAIKHLGVSLGVPGKKKKDEEAGATGD